MLYVIALDTKLIAASTSLDEVYSYLYNTLVDGTKYRIDKIDNSELEDDILSDESIILHKFNGITITGYELNFILKHIRLELRRTVSVLDDLKYIMDEYKIDKRDKRLFKETRKAINNIRTKENFLEALQLKEFIQYIHGTHDPNYLRSIERELNYGRGVLY